MDNEIVFSADYKACAGFRCSSYAAKDDNYNKKCAEGLTESTATCYSESTKKKQEKQSNVDNSNLCSDSSASILSSTIQSFDIITTVCPTIDHDKCAQLYVNALTDTHIRCKCPCHKLSQAASIAKI